MIKDIIKHPTPLSLEYGTDVRVFDEKLFSLIDDLKDTINENNLAGLAAFQIGSYYNVIVVKNEKGEFIELINSRLISHKGKVESSETTAYYGDVSVTVSRFEKVSIVYQDRDAKDCSIQAEGELAILLQRKLDYAFGSTFLHKLSSSQKDAFFKKLKSGIESSKLNESCPTTFKRDYLVKLSNIFLVVMFLLLLVSFFIDDKSTLWSLQLYLALSVVLTNIVYFFYAHYEAKKYTSCISCQTGNIVGTSLIALIKLSVVLSLSYFLI
jgi:peptide deformylase